MNTETGAILKDLRKSKQLKKNRINLVYSYAKNNNLSLKDVGIYEFPNGHLIFDHYPSENAKKLLQEILNK